MARSKSTSTNNARNRKVLALVATTAALAVAITGCSANGSTPTTKSAVLTNSLPTATKDVQSITWDLPHGEPASIDPLNSYDYSPDLVISNVCDSLLRLTSDYKITSNLATYKVVSPLETVYTIRSGVKFWDGNPLTNVDVAYSLNRDLDPSAPSNFLFTSVKSITATGSNQVTVLFTKPDELFNKEMAFPVAGIVEKSFVESAGATFGTSQGKMMCSGPLEVSSWTAGSQIVLTRNDDYWNKAFRSRAKTIRLKFVTDSSALSQGLLSGEIDGAYEVPATAVPRLQKSKVGSVYFGKSNQSINLDVFRAGGPLADVKLRKALMIAIDRPALATSVYNGAATANYTIIPSDTWDPSGTGVYKTANATFEKTNSFNLDAAKKLVKSTSYSGTALKLAILAGDDTQSQMAQYIQQQASEAGLKITIDALQPLQYSNAQYDPKDRVGLDLLLSPTYSQTEDPLESIGFDVTPGATYNYTNYNSAKVLALLTKAQAELNGTARAKLVVEAQSLYEKQYLSTALLNIDEISFVNKRLTGATTSFAYMFQPSLALLGAK